MNRIKQVLRRLLLICLIVLAGVGIGLSGGVPLPNFGKREDKQEITNESVEVQEGAIDKVIPEKLRG